MFISMREKQFNKISIASIYDKREETPVAK